MHMAHADKTAARLQRDEAVEDAVVSLLNNAVAFSTTEGGRAALTCKMCGARDENHTTDCPVPALEQWINPVEGRALIWS
jgi:hypothetical protein